MKGKLNQNGILEIERAGKFKQMKCKKTAVPVLPEDILVDFCDDDCALFEEPEFHDGARPQWTLNLCEFKVLTFSELEDER